MTEQEKPKPKNLIPSSFTQAFLAGASGAAVSYVIGVPIEHIPRVAVAGAGYSLFRSWQDSRFLTAPKKKKGRQIPFNHGKGQSNIKMELSVAQGGYLARESYFQAIVSKLAGKRQRVDMRMAPVGQSERPNILNEFVFYSHYRGQVIELREKHVKLFLNDAWKNRSHGKGLSRRRWDRERNKRPAWYQELSPIWYFGMSILLWDARKSLNIQLVVETGYQWHALAIEPRELLCCLKWHEYKKRV